MDIVASINYEKKELDGYISMENIFDFKILLIWFKKVDSKIYEAGYKIR